MDSTDISIRLAAAADVPALRAVAERDSRLLPRGDLLVAEAQGEVQAALSLQTGEFVADPFVPPPRWSSSCSCGRAQSARAVAGGRRGRVGKLAASVCRDLDRGARVLPFPRTAAECAWTREHSPSA